MILPNAQTFVNIVQHLREVAEEEIVHEIENSQELAVLQIT
jgi:hypothetical protein